MKQIKYPNQTKLSIIKNNIPQSRGSSLENDINISNNIYIQQEKCFVYKKPTPIKIHTTKNGIIVKATFESKSTTDYNGVISNGLYIDFEAKETRNKNLLPIANIHPHQLKHLKNVITIGGMAFLLIRFSNDPGTFMYDAHALFRLIERGNKSITRSELLDNGNYIEYNYSHPVDYLAIINKTDYAKGKNE
jgi:recombination protein U